MPASWLILLRVVMIPCNKIRDNKNAHKNSQLDSQEHLSAKTGLTNIKAMGVLSHIFLLVAFAFHMVAN
jgi:hypothetical protein